jgi:hypothetical protein
VLEVKSASKTAARPGACAALILLAAALAGADQVEYTGYYFGDNGHNTVATTAFSLAKTLYHRTVLLLDVELDQTTIPPLTGTDAVTGASRPHRQISSEFRKNRGQLIGGLEQGLGDNTRLGGSYYFSHEVDYSSQSVIGTFTQDLFQKNLTISLKGQYTVDSVGEITATGHLLNYFKETHQASLSVTQLLSRTTVLRLGGDGMRNLGFLSDPYRNIPGKDGTIIREVHPAMRWRGAGWAEISQYLNGMDASVIVNYRYAADDWDLKSHTLQLKLNKYVTPDWVLSPEYRFYNQTEATFKAYGGFAKYHTADYKLHAFTAHNIGAGLTCFLRAYARKKESLDFLAHSSVALLYFHYFNDEASILPTDPFVNYLALRRENFSCDALEARLRFEF